MHEGDERTARDDFGGRGIQSIEIGCKLLRAIEAASGPIALKDIAAAVDMAPSKVRFYLLSFLRERLLIQDPLTSRYSLGPFAIRLGMAALRQSDLVALAREAMLHLADVTGLTVFLTLWGNRGPTIVSKFEGRDHSPITIRVGHVLPLTTSATGTVFFTHLPLRNVAPILEQERPGDGVHTAPRTTADPLERIASRIRETGFAMSDNQLYEGFTGISAPIFGPAGEIEAALTVLGPSRRYEDGGTRDLVITQLLAATLELSAQLGYDGAS